MDEEQRIAKKILEIKDLLELADMEDFYDDEEIERLARLPIESSLPLISQLVVAAIMVSRDIREQDKEDKEKFQEENA